MSSMLKPPTTAQSARRDRTEAAEETVSTVYVRSRNFAEENRTGLIVAAVGIAVIFLGVLGYFYYQGQRNIEANELLGAILPVYEAGEYEQAVAGTGTTPGLIAIADDFGRTEAGNLAAFYAGNALFELGRFEEADQHYGRFSGSDFLRASALAGRGASHEELGRHSEAARFYERAADAYRSAATAPEFLLDAARNYEAAGDYAAARRALESISADYAEAPLAGGVAVHLARIEARQAAAQ